MQNLSTLNSKLSTFLYICSEIFLIRGDYG